MLSELILYLCKLFNSTNYTLQNYHYYLSLSVCIIITTHTHPTFSHCHNHYICVSITIVHCTARHLCLCNNTHRQKYLIIYSAVLFLFFLCFIFSSKFSPFLSLALFIPHFLSVHYKKLLGVRNIDGKMQTVFNVTAD